MKESKRLEPEKLRWMCNDSCFSFASTEELPESHGVIGQERAVEAIEFGMGINSGDGFNIFVLGPAGAGRTSIVQQFVEEKAREKQVPDDWCYIYNFKEPHKPRALRLPPGKGRELQQDMEKLIANLKEDIRRALEQEDYEKERNDIMNEMQREQNERISNIEQKARKQGFTIQRGSSGFMIVPLKEDNTPMSSQEISQMDDDERKNMQDEGAQIQEELQDVLRDMRNIEGEAKKRLEKLQEDTILFAVEHYIEDLKEKYSKFEIVDGYLDRVKDDVVKNATKIAQPQQQQQSNPLKQLMPQEETVTTKYTVNLIVDNGESEGAPVIMERRPTFDKLVGKLERKAQFGMLMTDFSMLKPGVLHQANGGYLVLEAMDLFQYPFAYSILKHALKEKEVKITDSMGFYQPISTESLEPEPIPLDIKVIVIGNPIIYYLLHRMDEDFSQLFKVKADFNTFMDRTDENINLYARFLASRCTDEGWKHFDTSGVARMVEYGLEMTQDQTKLSTQFSDICDMAREADYVAEKRGENYINAAAIQEAIDAKKKRSNKIEERIQEFITRGDIYIDTDTSITGQVNGLSIADLGDYAFGRPSRITARTYVGRDGVVNIDREAKLSGPIHDKGVLILSGFVNGHYGQNKPISLSASLVFEQLYEGVDGDSASSSELYTLLSSLAEVPLKQGIAVTGSVNQHGEIQPVGGVTQKIEGFYDICKAFGLTGNQGVIIPHPNVKNLMLKKELVEAVEAGKFHIYSVNTIGEGMEILSGMPFGERQDDGSYPDGTVNAAVDRKLASFAEQWDGYKNNGKNQ